MSDMITSTETVTAQPAKPSVFRRLWSSEKDVQLAHETFGGLATTSVPTRFFQIGIMFILFESLFEIAYHSLAFTPFSTRAFIGIHLWPSQIWFIFAGTLIAAANLVKNRFVVNKRIFMNVLPMFIVLAVYTIWTFLGVARGHEAAIDLFREMVFAGISLPAIVYLAQFVQVRDLFDTFLKTSLVLYPIAGLNAFLFNFIPFGPSIQLGFLILGCFAYSYYLFKAIKNTGYLIPAILMIIPTLLMFSKPMLALMFALPPAIAVISTMVTRKQLKYSISRRGLKLISITFFLLIISVIGAWYLNILLDGRIEFLIRMNFLKERIDESGSVYSGDLSGGRMVIWGNALKIWAEYPIFGSGLGTAVPIRNESLAQIHNYYLQALMDTGLVGTITLAACWFVWYKRVFRTLATYSWDKEKTIYASLLAYIVAFFIYAIYGLPMIYLAASHFFWVCIGLLSVFRPRESESPDPEPTTSSTS
jgi:O-antigen ligase